MRGKEMQFIPLHDVREIPKECGYDWPVAESGHYSIDE
jgi:hypothetical protein